jgi:hypothetical protein
MNRTTARLTTAVILVAASSLLVNPALAQFNSSAPNGCSGDFVCGDDPSVVTQWPLDRWLQVPRAPQPATIDSAETKPPAPRTTAATSR